MKKYFILAAAALAFAACTSDEIVPVEQTQQTAEENAVTFDAYTNRATTRAGVAGSITTPSLQTGAHKDVGFGVFGFYTDNNEYDPQATPNFMYNQQVLYKSSVWTYSPVKYWPNEYGASAISDDADKVTFFAYAPYVDVTPSTGKISSDADWGITGMTRNTSAGDPLVKYMVNFDPTKSVDLLWGVNEGGLWEHNVGNTDYPAGKPWLNVQHAAAVNQKLKFQFLHATSQLNVQIDADVDDENHNTTTPIGHEADGTDDTKTKVYVRSISFTGLAVKGSLNLNNTTANQALWMDYNGTNDLESGETVTIYDGRKDGKEGTLGATAANEKQLGLNATIISDDGNTTAGVTKDPKNLFQSATTETPVYVIPTGDEVEVEIVYDIETEDSKLANYLSDGKTAGSSIENRIRKKILFDGVSKFENGKSYIIKLHLGMNSVKFDAAVTEWVAAVTDEPWLPSNTKKYYAGSTYTVTVDADATSMGDFILAGLTPTSSLAKSNTSPASGSTLSPTTTPSTGEVNVTGTTITANATVSKVSTADAIKVTESGAGTKVTSITLVQLPKAFVGSASITGGNTSFDITTGSGSGTVTDTQWDDATISITKQTGGVGEFNDVTKVGSSPSGNQFSYAGGTGKGVVTLGTAAVAGDVYKITIKVGDADAVTFTVTVS